MKRTIPTLLQKLFCAFLIVGCSWHIDSPTLPLSTPSLTSSFTPAAELIASATQTSTTLPIFTPLPTLSVLEREKRILDLFLNNSDCNLPCWWGIIPGETTWQEVWKQLSPLTPDPYISNISSTSQFVIPVSDKISPTYSVDIRLDIKDTIVQVINTYTYKTEPPFMHRIDRFLNDYGKPTEVWIHTYRSNFGAGIPADVLLFYRDQGILARYFTNSTEIEAQDTALICLDADPVLTLWSPDNQIRFDEAQDLARLDYKIYDKPLMPLNEATGRSIEEFYSYRTREFFCITTMLSIWPDP